jgi:hypothetical protein
MTADGKGLRSPHSPGPFDVTTETSSTPARTGPTSEAMRAYACVPIN